MFFTKTFKKNLLHLAFHIIVENIYGIRSALREIIRKDIIRTRLGSSFTDSLQPYLFIRIFPNKDNHSSSNEFLLAFILILSP